MKISNNVTKFLFLILLPSIIGFSIPVYTQSKQLDFENKLVEYFQKHTWEKVVVSKDSLYTSPFNKKYNVAAGRNLHELDTAHIIIKNPYYASKYEDAEEEKDIVKNFPRSFSVIYQNTLVSLFENGRFACYNVNDIERATALESKLNTKRFKYHWIANNRLIGLSGNTIFYWNDNKWIKFKDKFPLKNQPKLFEDEKFLVYCDCFGEFGGTVYFFEKSTSKTYFTESTCANSVIKDTSGYNVLAHLGHGMGFTVTKIIEDPTKLTLLEKEMAKSVRGEAIGYTDKSNAFKKKTDFYGIQVFSSFNFKGKTLYIVHLSDLTFIAEIKGSEIEIVHPLFFSNLYTHNPVTSQYGNYTLINLDHYGTGLYREIAVLLINGNKITKLDWNENHDQ